MNPLLGRVNRPAALLRAGVALLAFVLLMGMVPQPADPQQPAAAPAATAPTRTAPNAAAAALALATVDGWKGSYSVPVERQARNVAIISIEGEIDAGGRERRSVMAASVRRRIELAARSGADAIVIDLNTPGGEVGAVIGICDAIKKSGIRNTVAWINPQAYSGGAIIALACREIITNDPATMGDAMPIGIGPRGISAIDNAELRRKVLPPLITEVLESTNRRNSDAGRYVRDKYLSMAIVANDVELWWVRNNETGTEVSIDRREFGMLFPGRDSGGDTRLARIPGVADAAAGPLDTSMAPTPGDPSGSAKLAGVASELVAQGLVSDQSMRPTFSSADVGKWTLVTKVLDGSAPATFSAGDMQFFNFASNPTVPTGAGTVVSIVPIRTDDDIKAFMGATNIRRLDRSWSEGLVVFLTSPWIRGLLIAVFLVSMFIELTHPGILLPGIVAVGALLTLILPSFAIGMASWWEVGAMGAGIGLLALELLVIPGFGFAGVVGALLLFAGLVGTFIPAGQGLFPDSPRQQNDLLRGMIVTLLATVTAIVGFWLIFRNLKAVPVLNKFVLRDPLDDPEDLGTMMGQGDDTPAVRIGAFGVAQTALRPSGKVLFGDEILDVVAEIGFISPGTRVRVVSATAARISVERADAPSGQS